MTSVDTNDQTKLTAHCSFDGRVNVTSPTYRPDRYSSLFRTINNSERICIQGSGLSYAMASAANGLQTVTLNSFSRILGFDTSTGQMIVEGGARVGDVLRIATKAGWHLDILPGHPNISIAGCVAMNVHGKSQYHSGHFENAIESFKLFHPDHGEVTCSRTDRPDLFWLTIGGLGLTGVLTEITLKLTRLEGMRIERQAIAVNSLLDALAQLERLESKFTHLYSWNNLCARGSSFGTGIVYAERFVEPISSNQLLNIDFGDFSSHLKPATARPRMSLFNGFTAPYVNAIYNAKERMSSTNKSLTIGPASFPIAGKEFYFSLIGRQGFIEYQCLIPRHQCESVFNSLNSMMTKYRINPSLGSLKVFKGKRRDLCFSGDGICLAIDIPVCGHPMLSAFLNELDQLMIEAKGLVNLAKDSRIERDVTRQMYNTGYDDFWSKLLEYDPKRRFGSELRSRLEPE